MALPLRPFGSAPFTVSALGLGAGAVGHASLSEADAERLLRGALDLGVTFVDTAPSYGASEERIGRYLADRRDAFVLSTKGGYGVAGTPDWTGDVVRAGVDRALRVLRAERIDVFHLHSCPLETLVREDILRALDDVRASGKVRVAAYSGENEPLAWAVTSGRFGGVQCSVNLFDQRSLDGPVRDAHARGLGVVAKRPLANGAFRFAERPFGHDAEEYWRRMRAMNVAPSDDDWLATAVRFAAHAPGVTTCIVGSRDLDHLATCARAVERGPLPDTEIARFHSAFRAHDDGWGGKI